MKGIKETAAALERLEDQLDTIALGEIHNTSRNLRELEMGLINIERKELERTTEMWLGDRFDRYREEAVQLGEGLRNRKLRTRSQQLLGMAP